MRQFMRSLWKTIPKVKLAKDGKKTGKKVRKLSFETMREGVAKGKLSTYYPNRDRRRLVTRHGRLKIVEPKKVKSA